MNFQYDYPLFRPPAEANNIILQVTLGCSYNNCSFCSMYKSKKFTIKSLEVIYKEIDMLSTNYPKSTKVFLADGDALALKSDYLLKILQYLNKKFINLRRISLYGSVQNILSKTSIELEELYQNNLKLIYFGIESGNDTVLKKITKGVTQTEIIKSLNIISKSNIKISATVILGIGGKEYTNEHIKDTAHIINNTTINYLSTLQLWLEDDAIDNFYTKFEYFIPLDDLDMIIEQKKFIELLNPKNKVIFRSNHVSNTLHLSGTIPKDKERLLRKLKYTINN